MIHVYHRTEREKNIELAGSKHNASTTVAEGYRGYTIKAGIRYAADREEMRVRCRGLR